MARDSRALAAVASRWRGWPWLLAGLLTVPNLAWIRLDESVWPWDPSWYGEVAVELWYALVREIGRWPDAMAGAFGSKAPGVAWLGQFFVPIGQSIGSIEKGLLLSVVLCQFATLLVIWRFVREWIPDRPLVAVFALLATGSAPLFVALSHRFFAEMLQLTAISWMFWLAAAAPRMSRARLTGHLALALPAAMLAKVSSPLYVLAPLLVILHRWLSAKGWSSAEDRRSRLAALFLTGAVLVGGCAAWYASNLPAVSAFVRYAATSEGYGQAGPLLGKSLYWLRALRSNFFYVWASYGLAALLLTGLGLRLATRHRLGRPTLATYRPALAAACFLQLVLVLVAFSLNRNEEHRYLLPILPAVVGLVSWGLASTRSNVLAAAAVVVMAVQLARVHAEALRWTERDPRIAYWLSAYQPNGPLRSELERIVEVSNQGDTANRYVIVGVELGWLNANSLAFLAAQEKLRAHERVYFTSLGHMATDPEAAWSRLQSLRPVYFVSLVPDRQPADPVFNAVSRPILERVADDPCFESEDFASRVGIVVYRRACAWP